MGGRKYWPIAPMLPMSPKPHIKTLVDALREMIIARIPRCARLINMIDHPIKINKMGDKGQNLHSFSEGLILDMEQLGWV